MKKQSPLSVFVLIFLTFGIYGIVWLARTRGEMVRRGADIPTTFFVILPILNIYYLWKWSQGVEMVTNGKMAWFVAFLLQWFLSGIGSAIIQDSFNGVGEGGAPMPATAAPATPAPAMAAAPATDPSQIPPAAQPPATPPTQLVQ